MARPPEPAAHRPATDAVAVRRGPDPARVEARWLADYPPGVPTTYDIPRVPLVRLLDDAARDFPDRPAIVGKGVDLDHRRLLGTVDAVAGMLRDEGILPGDRVLVALPNLVTSVVVLLAVWRLGAVVVALPHRVAARRLHAVAHHAAPAAAITTRRVVRLLAGHDDSDVPGIALVVDDDRWLARGPRSRPAALAGRLARRARRPRTAPLPDGVALLTSALHATSDDPVRHVSVPAASPALLAYQDPDPPRGVVLSHANLVAGAFQARLWVPDIHAGEERILVADELSDVRALIMGPLLGLLCGAAVVVLDEPDGPALARAVARERPTVCSTTPARLRGLLAGEEGARHDLTSLRVVLAGGAPLDPQLAADLERRTAGARVRETFGPGDAAPLTHAQPVYGRVVTRTMGVPVTGTRAAVVDPDHLDVLRAPGDPGLLLVRGPQVAAGYWRDAPGTAAGFVDGWLVTGELVTVDPQGVFRHVGHRSEVAVRNGVLLVPRRIEAAIERHPGVVQAGVSLVGEVLAAAVVVRRRRGPRTDELLAHCRAMLEPSEVPDRLEVVDALPQTPFGALDRAALARQFAHEIAHERSEGPATSGEATSRGTGTDPEEDG